MIGAIAYFGVGTLVIVTGWVLWMNHRAELARRRLVRDLDAMVSRPLARYHDDG